MIRWKFDDEAQRAVRDLVLAPAFYGKYSKEGRYVFVEKGRLATILQMRLAVDTIFQRRDGSAVCVEEKIVRNVYDSVTLETHSCTVPGHESPGWMQYGEADWLNYVMCSKYGNVICHVMDFQKLKEVFWPEEKEFPPTTSKQHNKSLCRIVPIDWIKERVGYFKQEIHPTPEGVEAVKAYVKTHYRKGNGND